ncbi:hypothetical protein VKT23_006744 [Stygiomarasmius scandens]|uniref:F-box domain-containing protein n=1 Tax=Marasmiellus scandens TaxID=2682957 RepID=A0ABR1JQF6_9AGAR
MNFPAALTLAGIDPFLDDEQSREIQDSLLKEEQMIASLDAEIAAAVEALEKLKRQRSEKQRLIYLDSAPSESEILTIRNNISKKETRLSQLDEQIKNARLALDGLVKRKADYENTGRAVETPLDVETPTRGDDLRISSLSLYEIDGEIQRQQTTIMHLTHEREDVLLDLDAQRSQLSPIRRLPLELLSAIFHHCLPDLEFISPRSSDAPMLLTHVCHGWRNLALSIPSLWSSISIHTNKDRCYPRKKLITTWLQRSGSKPLHFRIHEDLRFDLVQELDIESFTTGADLLEFFMPDYYRWQRVSLEYRDWKLGHTGFQNIHYSPPILEHLSLIRDYWDESMHAPLRALFSAPRLQSVHWDGILRSYPNPADIMPLHQLRELSLNRNILDSAHFFTVLAQAPNLVVCNLYVTFFSVNEDRPILDAPLVFPHLNSLRLASNVLDERICDNLIAPSLEEFSMIRPTLGWNGFTPERFWSHENFKKFWQKSRFALKTLDLTDADITPIELLDLLQCFSSTLENLALANDHVEHKCVGDAVLRALTPSTLDDETDQSKWLCPNLGYIKFWDCICSTDGLMAEMFEKRWDYGNEKVKRLKMALVSIGDEENHPNDLLRSKKMNQLKKGFTLLQPIPTQE